MARSAEAAAIISKYTGKANKFDKDDSSTKSYLQSMHKKEEKRRVENIHFSDSAETSNEDLFVAFEESDYAGTPVPPTHGNDSANLFESHPFGNNDNTGIDTQLSQEKGTFPDWNATEPNFNDAVHSENKDGDWNFNTDLFSKSNVDLVDMHTAEKNSMAVDANECGSDVGVENDDYIPPPNFGFDTEPAFVPDEEHFEDDSDEETLLDKDVDSGNIGDIVIRSVPLHLAGKKVSGEHAFSSQNPLNGNIILCRKSGKKWFLDEVDPSSAGTATASIELSCAEIKRGMDSTFGIIPCGVHQVCGMAAGVHFQNNCSRVKVGMIISLLALGATEPIKVLAIWKWGYGRERPFGIQKIVSAPGSNEYDPRSLAVGNGLFFVSGSVDSIPILLVAKPHIQSEWVPFSLNPINKKTTKFSLITQLELCPQGETLALTIDGESISVWNYADLASRDRKKIFAEQHLTLVCVLHGGSFLENVLDDSTMNKNGNSAKGELIQFLLQLYSTFPNKMSHCCCPQRV